MNKNFLLSKDELKKIANAKTSEEKEKLKKHYTNVFYNELVKYNTILSDEEFYEFCITYISNVIDEFNDKDYYLSERISNLIKKENKMMKTEEKLLLRYINLLGLNDNIIDYFINKYKFILVEYENKPFYEYLKNNFSLFVKSSLENYDDMKKNIRVSIERQINDKVDKIKQQRREQIKNIRLLSKEEQEDVRKYCFYIKDYLYDLYKCYINEELLKSAIDKKYDEYFNAYVNGISSTSLTKYVDDRLVVYLDHLKANQVRKDSYKDEINKNLLEKLYIIYWYEYKCKAFIPCLEILEQAYEKACNKYYELPRDSSIEDYLSCVLRQVTSELNKKYDINYIKNITKCFKENLNVNCFSNKEQMDTVLDNLEKYYLDNKLYRNKNCDIKRTTYKLEDRIYNLKDYNIKIKTYKPEKYEDFLTRMILSFNKDEYKVINNIKNSENIDNTKVLKK